MGKTYTSSNRKIWNQIGTVIIRKTIILGLGNLLLGDEGAAIHIINKLKEIKLPPHVELIDGATGGFRLIPVFEKHRNDRFIIIDALRVIDEDRPVKDGVTENRKGDLYLIPLDKLYCSMGPNYEKPEFISFHQTAIFDVLLLMLKNFNTKINGYFLGIDITGPTGKDDLEAEYNLRLSPEVDKKIDDAIEIIRKHL